MSKQSGPDDDLFQLLLELEYGLVDEPEAHSLRERIRSDAEVARVHAEVLRTRSLLVEAAVVNLPTVVLRRPTDVVASTRAASSWHHRWLTPFLSVAALLLVTATVGGEWWFTRAADQVANESVVINVAGPSTLLLGGVTPFEIQTQNLRSEPVASKVDVALVDRTGRSLLQQTVATDRAGQATLLLPPGTTAEAPFTLVASRPSMPSTTTSVRPEYAPRVTRLSTDRPVYRPGDRVYFRALTLERSSLEPVEKGEIAFDLRDPQGEKVADSMSMLPVNQGVAAGSLNLSSSAVEGRYRLTASSPAGQFVEQSRFIDVRTYREPLLRKKLELDAPTVTAGGTLKGNLLVENAKGEPLRDAPVTIRAEIDNTIIQKQELALDANGKTNLWFSLPPLVKQGPLVVDINVGQGAETETITREVPLTQGSLDLEFFPESGSLVTGVSTQVYFQAFDVNTKPVAVEGRVLDDENKVVATFKSENEGRGRFEMLPQSGRTYHVEVTSPPNVTLVHPFPQVAENREIVLTGGKGVFEAGQSFDIEVLSNKADIPFIVSAYCREIPVGFVLGHTIKGRLPIRMNVVGGTEGVVRLTLFDRRATPLMPVAERLVYRRPSHQLSVAINPEESSTSPATVSLFAANEKGTPVAGAVLGVSVVDRLSMELSDEKRAGIDAHFLLLSEIHRPQDIENADFLLRDDETSARALDLVLGTHGWRQFRPAMVQNALVSNLGNSLDSDVDVVQEPVVHNNAPEIEAVAKEQLSTIKLDHYWYRIGTGVAFLLVLFTLLLVRAPKLRLITAGLGLALVGLFIWQFAWNPIQPAERRAVEMPRQIAASAESGTQEEKGAASANSDFDSTITPMPTPPPAPATAPVPPSIDPAKPLPAATPEMPEELALMEPKDNPGIAGGSKALDQARGVPPIDAKAPDALAKEADTYAFQAKRKVADSASGPPAPFNPPTAGAPAPVVADKTEKPAAPLDQPVPLGARQSYDPINQAGERARPTPPQNSLPSPQAAPRVRSAPGSRSFAAATEVEGSPSQDVQRRFAGFERVYSPSFRGNLGQKLTQNPTAYWNPLLYTDEKGKATISFDPASDAATYIISVEGHTAEGRLGSARSEWKSTTPKPLPTKRAER